MPDILAIIGIAVLLAIVLGVAAALVLRRRSKPAPAEPTCPKCGRPLAPGVANCLDCAQTPPPVSLRPDEAQSPALIGIEGPLADRIFPIAAAPRGLTIGRSPDNDVVIADALAVSRYHAQVVPEDEGFVLYDRDSANGTVVNGVRVFRHVLMDGDVVQICGVRLGFSRSGVLAPGGGDGLGRPRGRGPEERGLGANQSGRGLGAQIEGWGPPADEGGEDALSVAPAPPTALPERIDGCVIEEILGRGGMSVVYRGRDAEGQAVAIKVLNVTDDYIVRKFVQEHQIGEMLGRHPYIRAVRRLGQDPRGNLFLVMEYVEGRSLRRLMGQLSEDQIVRIVGQSCLALAYAHERNIVHRDIKPENILIDAEGRVRLTDFGIAKLTSSVTMTTDRVVGTPEYLSPEQARGDQRVGPASDIYSLGIVLYELLTGRVPFPLPRNEGAFHAAVTVLRQHIHTPPPPLKAQNQDVSRKLEKVALRALEKNPKKRYGTAVAMCEALGYREAPAAPQGAPRPGPPLRMVIERGAGSGREIMVGGEDVTIGRADLDPEDVSISRRHAILSVQGGQLWLEDISLNGTRVNGERVFGQTALRPGDHVEIGNSLLALSTAPPSVA